MTMISAVPAVSAVVEKKGTWLNVGSSGFAFPGFVNIDRQVHHAGVQLVDIRLGLPFPSESAEVVIASHVLEHLHPFFELPSVLKEIHRVMMPSGVLRVAVPDLQLLTQAYSARDPGNLAETQRELKGYIGVSFEELPPALQFSVIAFGNNSGSVVFDGHYFAADFEAMVWLLSRGGFKEVAQVDRFTSRHPTLLLQYRDINAPEQIVVEATR